MLRYGGLVAALVVIGIVVFGGDGDAPGTGDVPSVAETDDPAGLPSPGLEAEGAGDPAGGRVAVPGTEAPSQPSPGEGGAGAQGNPGAGAGSEARSPADGSGSEPADAAPGAGGADAETRGGGETGSVAQDPSVERILRATSAAYEDLRSLRAEFDQEVRNALLGRTTRSSGTLYQRRPDRFLMDFSDPEGDVIVSDGTAFWMYYPSVDEKQVMRSSRGGGLDLHAQFIGDPVSRFEATYEGRESVRGRPAHVLTLVPREPLGYRRLKVWIDAEDHLVRRFELTETNENVRHFELHDLRVNPPLADSLFEFTPPADAIVVNAG